MIDLINNIAGRWCVIYIWDLPYYEMDAQGYRVVPSPWLPAPGATGHRIINPRDQWNLRKVHVPYQGRMDYEHQETGTAYEAQLQADVFCKKHGIDNSRKAKEQQ